MRKSRMLFLVVVGLLASSSAWAQTGAVIGTATDETGGVLPGVTVEASSPALIEGVRATVTNEQGLFRIIELPPGVYALTFTLQGFRTARTEDVVLTTGFTGAVNASLVIGGVTETITVSSMAVQVDIVNTTVQQVLSSEVLQALPMGQQLGALRNLLVGAIAPRANVRDVGGNTGEGQHGFSVNGSRQADFQRMQDGMVTNTLLGAGNWTSTQNPATTEEVVVTTGGFSAAAQTGGGVINTVSRTGGNVFSGTFIGDFATEEMRSDNLSDTLRARGATTPAAIRQRYDVGGGFGGPIVRDKLWFFSGARYWTTASNTPGNFFNKTPASLFYVPDLDNPAYGLNYYSVVDTKVTWQATAKQKFMGSYGWERSCNCFYNIDRGLTSPEASGSHFYSPNRRIQGTWTYPVTNNLLLWAGVTDQFFRHNKIPEGGGTESVRSVLELSNNYRYGAPGNNLGLTGSFGFQDNQQRNQNFTLSYLTGGHYLKVGGTTMQGILHAERTIFEDMGFRFQNGVPQAVDLWATPYQWSVRANYLSIFAEDQWTTNRLTLNLGVRYDGLRGSVPDQNLPAGNFVPARSFKAISNRPSYNDISPRLGVAYDLFGTGQTALKGSLSRSPVFKSPGNVNTIINPVRRMAVSARRSWDDANGDFIPQESELGPLSNSAFGTVSTTLNYADDVVEGWHVREYSWMGSVSLEHQLSPNMTVSAGYFRTWFGNFQVTDNLAVGPSDYDEYCVTAPSDARLPGGGGNEICGLYDLSPAAFGRVDQLVVPASNFGDQSEVYNGINLSVNANVGGYRLGGGLSSGTTTFNSCFIVDSPQDLRFCDNKQNWYAKTQVRIFGVVPLPARMQASASYQLLPSIPLAASYVVRNAQVEGLGRNLSGGRNARRTIDLIEPNTEFSEGWSQQLDIRLSSNVNVGGVRFVPNLAIFNLFNENSVLQTQARIGRTFQNARNILGARTIKLGAQIHF